MGSLDLFDSLHAEALSSAGSGTISSSVTAPPVKSRTSFMRSSGTPERFHCDTADGVLRNLTARAAALPFSSSSHVAMSMHGSLGETKPPCQAAAELSLFSIHYMGNARRRRFLAWYEATYDAGSEGRAKFMRESAGPGMPALTKGRVSQLFDESAPFGELAGRNLAARFGLDADYFERDHGEGAPFILSDQERALVLAFRAQLTAASVADPAGAFMRARAAKRLPAPGVRVRSPRKKKEG